MLIFSLNNLFRGVFMWGFNFASTDLRVETEEQVGPLCSKGSRRIADVTCPV